MTDIDDLSASLCRCLPCYLCGERAETVSTIVCDETGTPALRLCETCVKAAANLSMFDFLNLAWKQKEAIEEVRSARLAMLQDYANDAEVRRTLDKKVSEEAFIVLARLEWLLRDA